MEDEEHPIQRIQSRTLLPVFLYPLLPRFPFSPGFPFFVFFFPSRVSSTPRSGVRDLRRRRAFLSVPEEDEGYGEIGKGRWMS